MFIRKIIRRLLSYQRVIIFKLFKGRGGKNLYFEKIKFYKPTSKKTTKKAFVLGNNVSIIRSTELVAFDDCPIIIGNNVKINQNCIIRPNVIISDNVSIGIGTSLITDSHEVGDSFNRAGKSFYSQILIDDGCWIGANCVIIGPCHIHKGAIIGAGSIVKGEIEKNSIYFCEKAKLIKKLN